MSVAGRMIPTNPSQPVDAAALSECIRASFDCAQACIACADACLGAEEVQSLTRCIRLNLDCADICEATGRIVSRQTALEPRLAHAALQACLMACRLCGDECEEHGQHGMRHCSVCAEAGRRCEQACNDLMGQMAA